VAKLQAQRRPQEIPWPPYSVIDGARDRSISPQLAASALKHASLYEGHAAEELGAFGPYLVEASTSTGIAALTGFAPSCLHLLSDASFNTVRQHLRHFLTVKLGNGRRVHFRFYDPRVLRRFLPTCLPDEWTSFFGPIDAFIVEGDGDERSEMLKFSRDDHGRLPTRVKFACR